MPWSMKHRLPILAPGWISIPVLFRTFWDRILDLHGLFRNEKGEPWEYMGHFAWIPVFNNDCRLDYDGKPVLLDGRETAILDWLAAQRRKTGK